MRVPSAVVSSVAVQTDPSQRSSHAAIADATPQPIGGDADALQIERPRIDLEVQRRIKAAGRRYRRLYRRYQRRRSVQRRLTTRLGRVTRQALQLQQQHQVNILNAQFSSVGN